MNAQTDYEMITEWLQQQPPTVAELTKDDVWSAYLAQDVLASYREPQGKYMLFDISRTMAGMEAEVIGWKRALESIKRGIAVLNGYLLIINARVPVYADPPVHDDAIVSRVTTGGYIAMTEQHRTMSLIPTGDLITISAAAQIIYGENTQSKRVMVRELIDAGRLQAFRDSTEQNPQKATRLARRQAIALKMQLGQ